ncbi:MAG: DUF1549 domain-containing protein [Aureliella sp.]
MISFRNCRLVVDSLSLSRFWLFAVAIILPAQLSAVKFAVGDEQAAAASKSADTSSQPISYEKQIAPIFRTHCQGCHQPAKAQGEYVMTDFASLSEAGESGDPAIVPGDADASYLYQQIAIVDGEAAMPKKGKPLHPSEIELIREWINQGAKNDSVESQTSYSSDSLPAYRRPPMVTALAFSPDGRWLASSGFHEVFLINTGTWETEKRLVGLSERIEAVSFSPDSKRLAVTGGSPGRLGEVQIWDVDSGELTLSKQITYDVLYGGRFSPDGMLVAFGATDNVVRAIDSRTGEQKLHQGAHDDWIRAVAFNPSGTHLLSAGRDMTVKLTEVATERFVDNVTSITPGALSGGINALAMHPSRDEVLVGGADGIPKVYRMFRETQRRIGDDANLIRRFPSSKGRIFAAELSPKGDYFATASTLDGKSIVQVYPYDFDSKLSDELKAILKKRVAERSADEKKKVAESRDAVSASTMEIAVEDSRLYALSYSADGKQLAIGGSDGVLRILSVEQGREVHRFAPVELQDTDEGAEAIATLLANSGMPIREDDLPQHQSETELLPTARLTSIAVAPTKLSLSTPNETVQLVVTGHYEGGATADLTRLATLSTTEGVRVDGLGLVDASKSGTIGVAFAGHAVQVAVECKPLTGQPTDFTRDVNPILSRLGCNSGTCHGAQAGKNGFKLSLRGYDPIGDLRALSDDLSSRRLNAAAPDSSLMLLKPIGAVPHEGGVLLTEDSVHYAILRQWIAEGAQLDLHSSKVASIEVFPKEPVIEREGQWQQFRVVASYPDGTKRDVTHDAFVESGNSEVAKSFAGGRVQALRRGEAPLLVRYEGAYAAATVTVMGDRTGFAWQPPEIYSDIDKFVADKWERMKIQPSDLAQDHEFLRRVRLDLTGLPPTVDEFREFKSDRRPSILKRMAKIEELIGSPDFVDHWTNKWADLLQVNSKFLGKDGAKAFRGWIHDAFEKNTPYDDFARQILTASGSNKDNPAASYYKILRDPDLIMENTTHLFLAIRFNCNKCHDHPFERWTQDQYYELAAYFAQTGLKKDPKGGNAKIGGTAVEGAKPLYEVVFDKPDGEIQHVRTGGDVPPAFPYECDYEAEENATRREQLAAWITSPDNPYFARSTVNRLWGYMTGTGLMEPLDDIRAGNPPTNPELLDFLTEEFINSDFDVQHVLRLICNSRTYQLSVASNQWNADDTLNYSHAKAKRLPAEVLYDAVHRVTGAVTKIPGVKPGTRAAALPDVAVSLPDGFLNNLGRPVRESACECERSHDLQLGPVMALVSGPTVGQAISDPQCELPKLAKDELTEDQLVREIFVRVLSREATEEEVQAIIRSADQIAVDHQSLTNSLAERESWWKGEKARLEARRMAHIEETKAQIAARKKAIEPERMKMEEVRVAKQKAAEEALAKYEADFIDVANQYLSDHKANNHWIPLAAKSLVASNKDALLPQADRSVVASGKDGKAKGGKGNYQLTYDLPYGGVRGLRLEALPRDGIVGGGPGLPANGNFVITELEAFVTAPGAKKKTKIKIKRGLADFSQDGFAPDQTFDGNKTNQRGWAVSPRGGTVHWLVLEFAGGQKIPAGSELQVVIHQNHNAATHQLARFRLSATLDAGELVLGQPEDFSSLAFLGEEARNKESLSSLFGYLEKSDPKSLELKSAVAQAKKPLPPDAELVGLESKLKLLQVETPDDPKLIQLRADFAASADQVENRRLTLAQDLTWALINSPAFLFNY